MNRSLRCPCGKAEHTPGEQVGECGDCETFYCSRCERWVLWDHGSHDDAPALCDDCFGAVVLPGVPGVPPLSEVTC